MAAISDIFDTPFDCTLISFQSAENAQNWMISLLISPSFTGKTWIKIPFLGICPKYALAEMLNDIYIRLYVYYVKN